MKVYCPFCMAEHDMDDAPIDHTFSCKCGNEFTIPANKLSTVMMKAPVMTKLVNCPECNRQISKSASFCPGCGYAMHPQQTSCVKLDYKTLFAVVFGATLIAGVIAGMIIVMVKSFAG